MRADRTLETWESWVDEAIRDARDRGDFDNLPGEGKPLRVERNPFAGDRELGFHVLKNANLLPRWMELDRELSSSLADLDRFLERSGECLGRLRTRVVRHEDVTEALPRKPRFGDWLRGSLSARGAKRQPLGRAEFERERLHARRQYLERAANVDKMIQEYNAALPDEIRWLERVRLLPDQAAARFDAASPRVEASNNKLD